MAPFCVYLLLTQINNRMIKMALLKLTQVGESKMNQKLNVATAMLRQMFLDQADSNFMLATCLALVAKNENGRKKVSRVASINNITSWIDEQQNESHVQFIYAMLRDLATTKGRSITVEDMVIHTCEMSDRVALKRLHFL